MKLAGLNKLEIWINNRKIGIDHVSICSCQADGCYARVFLNSGKSYLVSKTLNCLEKQLHEEYFLRCHRSYLVNMREIISIDIKSRIVYQKLYQIPVSHRKLAELLYKRNAYMVNE